MGRRGPHSRRWAALASNGPHGGNDLIQFLRTRLRGVVRERLRECSVVERIFIFHISASSRDQPFPLDFYHDFVYRVLNYCIMRLV